VTFDGRDVTGGPPHRTARLGLVRSFQKTHVFSEMTVRENEGETILLAEQNADFALKLADRAYVIDKGAICYAGTARDLLADERIRREHLAV
jgi:ABC-type branched-subunit amino acid transport system ATPase component